MQFLVGLIILMTMLVAFICLAQNPVKTLIALGLAILAGILFCFLHPLLGVGAFLITFFATRFK